MSLAIDGTVADWTDPASSRSVSLTTSSANDLIYVVVACNGGPVLSVTATGLTFTFRSRSQSGPFVLETWVAPSASALTSKSITVTQTSSSYISIVAFGVSNGGVLPSLDINPALPNLVPDGNSGGGATTSTRALITTTEPNCLLLGAYRFSTTQAPTNPGTGWTFVNSGGYMMVEYKLVSSAQVATDALISTGFNGGNNNQNGGIGDAITSDSPFPPLLDGTPATNQGTNTATGTVTLSTTKAGDIIVLAVHTERNATAIQTITGVTDVAGLTWAKRGSISVSNTQNLEVWWAYSSGILTSDVITFTFSANPDDWTAGAFGVSGADSTSPWDSNGSLPATTTASGSTPTISGVSTTTAQSMLIAFAANKQGGNHATAGSGDTLLFHRENFGGGLASILGGEYKYLVSALSSGTVSFGSTSPIDFLMFADALVPPHTVNTNAAWASTEAKDVFAGTGQTGGAVWASTESKDAFAGAGTLGGPNGSWASTEVKDLMSGVGYLALTAVWASTEAKDTFAFAAHNLALDGSAHNQSTTGSITTGTVTLTTANAHDVIVLCVDTKGGSVSSIADVAGLTWTKRTKFNPAGNTTEDMEIWWAHAPTALTADVITITFSTTNGYAAVAFGVSGANTGAPFDTHNANSLNASNGGSGNPSVSITTDFTHDQFIFAFYGSDDVGENGVGSGITTFLNRATNGAANPQAGVGYVIKTTNQTSLALSFAQSGGTFNNRYLMADAICARVDVIGTLFTSDVKDTFAGAGYPQAIGTFGSTEAKDVFAGTGTVPPFGTLGATEAKDAMGFVGEVGRPLGVDTTAAAVAHNTTACSIGLTTTVTDDIIVLGILNGGHFNSSEVGSITDTSGLVWRPRQRRKQFGTNPIMETWWAKKHTPGAITITVNFLATTGFICLDAIAISGARANAPWDTHSGAGIYNDNFGTGNPTGVIYSNSAHCMGLAFYSSNDVNNTGVSAGWTALDHLESGENIGQLGRMDSAYRLFTTQQLGTTTVQFGNIGGGSNNRVIMQDVIVGNNDVTPNASTADVVRWFFDGHGNQNIVAMSGSNNSLSQSVTTYNPDTTLLVAAMVQSGVGTRVGSVSDDGGNSGWARRSIVTDTVGNNSLELWWVQLNAPFSGNVTVTLDSNVRPGDILGFVVIGINGPDLFARGEIFDGHSSLPKVAHADAVSDPVTGNFSSLNENVLEIVIAANQSQDQRGFQQQGWLQFVGNFFGSESGILVSHSPLFNIALQAKYSGPVVMNDSTTLPISPSPTTWMTLADIMPVGPSSPPQGTWVSEDVPDRFGNSGAFTRIGIDSRGWVGFPPNHAAMAPTETKDRTSNSGGFSAIWDGNGWIGYLPASMGLVCVEAKDVSSLHAWLLGPTTILAQMASTEVTDHFQFAATHSQYTTADSKGDRTSRITVTTNASIASGSPENLVNGLRGNNTTAAFFVNNAQSQAIFFKFDFGSPRCVQEALWFQTGPSAFPGLWVWRGSNDNTNWTTISAAPFVLDGGNSGSPVLGDISRNVTAYRYYQLLQTTNAGGNDSPWLWETEFKVEGVVGILGAVELKDRFASAGLVIPTALPIPARKRRLLIVT